MKSYKFFDTAHAQNYLQSCVILYDGEPVWIEAVGGGDEEHGFLAIGVPLNGKTRFDFNTNSSHCDYTIPELGFVNYVFDGINVVTSVSRIPSRIFKIGLHHNALALRGWNELSQSIRSSNMIRNIGLRNCIVNEYPSFKEALKKTKEGAPEYAFCKHFAIGGNGTVLLYKGMYDVVGDIKEGVPTLYPEYFYLKELLATYV